ncbi:U4/U6.U5 small nuclear ribonucleoprotein 27 kDa protein-like [Paramacrobiotus metropolitanus]|uniref:U4/U6.U5 small nuclear ribonucleoprotein 27 kDa protein-like n=1 Tax=Paramacrobiotus metropolitanus TaxID=2943436 RepID=UPI0024464B2E|nr:U4/U6.U5 small nuclear ribonucleoprotein 27 kDa protein-like [Paramacrobiotus metropolitanus]
MPADSSRRRFNEEELDRRDRDRKRPLRRSRSRSPDRKRRRSRSRSPIRDRADYRRTRDERSRSPRDRRERERERDSDRGKDRGPPPEKPVNRHASEEKLVFSGTSGIAMDDDEEAMVAMMGFTSFDSTKGKKVEGNDTGMAAVAVKRKYRQYMNRRGGFNRPLDPVH